MSALPMLNGQPGRAGALLRDPEPALPGTADAYQESATTRWMGRQMA